MSWMSCMRFAGLMIGGALLLTGCLPTQELPPPIEVAKGLRAEYLAVDIARPVALAATADGRVFVADKDTGQIRVIKEGRLLDTPFATVPVNYAGDRGLLGLATHPRFAENGRLYVFYTRSDTGTVTKDPQAVIDHRIVYFVADGDLAAGGEVFVASIPCDGARRIGGQILFAADRKLLAALGDHEDTAAAQDPASLYGKVLRYNDNGTIPSDNPTDGSPVYVSGLREPRSLALDPISDGIFLIDRNSAGLHELNLIVGGKNYGWPEVVGLADTDAELAFVAQHPEYADPLNESTRQLVGLSFNPSSRYGTKTRLHLFTGVADQGQIRNLTLSEQRTTVTANELLAAGFPTPLLDVAFTPAGTLYVACESAVLRMITFP